MARLNRKIVVMTLVLVVSGVIGVAVWWLVSGESKPDPYLEEARGLIAEDRYGEALIPLQKANEITGGKRADILGLIGRCYNRMKPEPDIDRAVAYYSSAKRMADPADPARTEYMRSLATIYLGGRAYPRALSEMTELIEAEPDNDANYRLLAQIRVGLYFMKSGREEKKEELQRAVEAIDTAIAKDPKNLENYELKLQMLGLKEGEDTLAEAEAVAKAAIENADNKADAHAFLGGIFRQAAMKAEPGSDDRNKYLALATKAYQDALQVEAGHTASLVGLAQIAVDQQDQAEAERLLREAIEKHPDKDQPYYYLVGLLQLQNRMDDVLKLVDEALAECPPVDELPATVAYEYRYRLLSTAAEIRIQKGEFDAAEQHIEQMRSIQPDDPMILYLKGTIAFQKQDFNTAFDMFQQAARRQADRARAVGSERARSLMRRQEAEYRFRLAMTYEVLNHPGRALTELDTAVSLLGAGYAQQRDAYRRERARLQITLGKYRDAETEAGQLLRGSPDDFLLLRIMAAAKLGLGDPSAARPYAEKCREVAPDRFEGYHLLARVLDVLNQPAEVEKVLLEGIEKASSKLVLYRGLIGFYRQQEMTEKLAALGKQIDDDQGLDETQKLGLHMLLASTAEARKKIIEEEIKRFPNDAVKRLAYAEVLMELNETDEAFKVYKEAYDLAVAQSRTDLLRRIWDRAWVLLIATDRADEAVPWIEQLPPEMTQERQLAAGLMEMVYSSDPPKPEIEGKTPSQVLQVGLGHLQKAIDIFGKLQSNQEGRPPDLAILRALAQAQQRLARMDPSRRGDALDKAEAYLSKIIQSQPQDIRARLNLASLYVQMASPQKALAEAREVLDRSPDNPAAVEVTALAYQSMADYNQAIRTREKLRALMPNNVDNLLRLALFYEIQGQKDKALEATRQAVAADPKAPEPTRQLALSLFLGGKREEGDALMEKFVAESENQAAALLFQARYYRESGRPEQAIEAVQKAAGLAPDEVAPVLLLSELLVSQDPPRYDEAVTVCDEFLKKDPGNLQARIQLCDVLKQAGKDLDRAEEELNKIIAEIPNDIRVRTILAVVWIKRGAGALAAGDTSQAQMWFDRARQKLGEIIAERPDFGQAYMGLADLELLQGRKQEAVEHLRRIPQTDPAYPGAMRASARINLELGNLRQARGDLENVLKIEPRDMRTRIFLSELYMRDKRFNDAKRVLTEALDKYFAEHFEVLRALVNVILVEGRDPAAAQAVADRIIRLYPDEVAAWDVWVRVMRARRQAEAALTRIRQVAEAHANDWRFRLLESDLLMALDRSGEAKQILSTLVAAHPDEPVLYEKLVDAILSESAQKSGTVEPAAFATAEQILKDGIAKTGAAGVRSLRSKLVHVYQNQRLYDKARAVAREMLADNSRDALAMFYIGQSELGLGNRDEALKWFRQSTVIDPTNAFAWNNIAWILAVYKGDLIEAWTAISRALNLMPDNPDLLDTAGWIKYLSNDADAAIELLDRSLQLKENPGTRFHLGMAQKLRLGTTETPADKKGVADKALELLRKYLEQDPQGEYAAEAGKAVGELESYLKDLEDQ